MRTFIALNLPGRERRRIWDAAEPLRDQEVPVRWVEADNLHLTLKFLGEVRPEKLGDVEAIVRRIASSTEPLSLRLGGFGAFPTLRKPRVIWLGVDATPALRCLKQDLEWALAGRGFEAETRDFHPHLTLGRANTRVGEGPFRDLDSLVARLEFSGRVDFRSLDLMRSRLGREGARYTVVCAARFEGA